MEPWASPELGPGLGASPAFQWRRGRARQWEPPSLGMALPSRPPGVWGDRCPHGSEATPVPQKMGQNLPDLYQRSLQRQVERWQRDTGLSELKPPNACGHFLTLDYELPAPLCLVTTSECSSFILSGAPSNSPVLSLEPGAEAVAPTLPHHQPPPSPGGTKAGWTMRFLLCRGPCWRTTEDGRSEAGAGGSRQRLRASVRKMGWELDCSGEWGAECTGAGQRAGVS